MSVRFLQRKARTVGALPRASRIASLLLVFPGQPQVHLVDSDPLALLTSIFHNTSRQHWLTLGSGAWPRIRAVVRTRRTRVTLQAGEEERRGRGTDSGKDAHAKGGIKKRARSSPKERDKATGAVPVVEHRRRGASAQGADEKDGREGRADAETERSKRKGGALSDERGKLSF
jgi:hypothetical protein